MLQITKEFKNKVAEALADVRKNFTGGDKEFATQWKIHPSVYNRIKNGERDGILKDAQWLNIGRELQVSLNERKWVAARTDVFNEIEEDVLFCKEHSKSRICVDDCGIGKTFTAKYLSRTLENCFYVDGSQAKGVNLLTREIAKSIGLESTGRLSDLRASIKYYLKLLPKAIVIIDETGDFTQKEFLLIKELWNGTEGACAWYLIGAEGLKTIMTKGIGAKKSGFKEIFSRFSEKYTTIVPAVNNEQKIGFYKKLITDVLSVNMPDKTNLDAIVRKCLVKDETGQIGGLRRAESLLILNS